MKQEGEVRRDGVIDSFSNLGGEQVYNYGVTNGEGNLQKKHLKKQKNNLKLVEGGTEIEESKRTKNSRAS